ncbi:hypothetical protein [Microcystis aeruginosa]|uniref:hypothetical protein n=1 Tax=Microcystis aeruginosa TaxID=1126 RepID=UPI0013301598|nr:hypothetical protein [Microcystis aeruginosa]
MPTDRQQLPTRCQTLSCQLFEDIQRLSPLLVGRLLLSLTADRPWPLYLKCRMNASATFFDKILTFAGDEIRPEYQPRSIGLILPSVGKLC